MQKAPEVTPGLLLSCKREPVTQERHGEEGGQPYAERLLRSVSPGYEACYLHLTAMLFNCSSSPFLICKIEIKPTSELSEDSVTEYGWNLGPWWMLSEWWQLQVLMRAKSPQVSFCSGIMSVCSLCGPYGTTSEQLHDT